jgi:hypothetical protein
LFWLSHEEKWPWIELSMGGGHRGSSERGERGGRGEERGRGHSCWEEEGGEGHQGASARGARGLLLGLVSAALREEESKKEKREKKRREGKKKRKKWENFPNLETSGKK